MSCSRNVFVNITWLIELRLHSHGKSSSVNTSCVVEGEKRKKEERKVWSCQMLMGSLAWPRNTHTSAEVTPARTHKHIYSYDSLIYLKSSVWFQERVFFFWSKKKKKIQAASLIQQLCRANLIHVHTHTHTHTYTHMHIWCSWFRLKETSTSCRYFLLKLFLWPTFVQYIAGILARYSMSLTGLVRFFQLTRLFRPCNDPPMHLHRGLRWK